MLPSSAFWQQREYATITSNVENTDYASLFKVVTKWHEWVLERKKRNKCRQFFSCMPTFLIVPWSEKIHVENIKTMLKIIDTVSIEYKINKDTCLNSGHVAHYHRAASILYTTTNQQTKLTCSQ